MLEQGLSALCILLTLSCCLLGTAEGSARPPTLPSEMRAKAIPTVPGRVVSEASDAVATPSAEVRGVFVQRV